VSRGSEPAGSGSMVSQGSEGTDSGSLDSGTTHSGSRAVGLACSGAAPATSARAARSGFAASTESDRRVTTPLQRHPTRVFLSSSLLRPRGCLAFGLAAIAVLPLAGGLKAQPKFQPFRTNFLPYQQNGDIRPNFQNLLNQSGGNIGNNNGGGNGGGNFNGG